MEEVVNLVTLTLGNIDPWNDQNQDELEEIDAASLETAEPVEEMAESSHLDPENQLLLTYFPGFQYIIKCSEYIKCSKQRSVSTRIITSSFRGCDKGLE